MLPGGRFQLAFGLCEKAPAHKVLTIAASRNCAPKVGNQPVCNNGRHCADAVDLGAYVLYNPVAGNSTDWTSVRTTIQEAIASPVLSNTKVSINRLTASCFPSTSLADFGKVTPSYQTIAAALESAGAASSTRFAMNSVLTAVNDGKFPSTTNVKALVVITNGDIEADGACGTPKSARQIATELFAKGVRTYAILSDKDEAKYPAGALLNAAEVAKAGGTFNEAYALNKGEAYGGIALSDLSSCKYVKPGHIDTSAELFYVDLSEFADAKPGAAAKPQIIPARHLQRRREWLGRLGRRESRSRFAAPRVRTFRRLC